ncbi:PilX N-terminal domain-containing pilus assembly protein [Pseudomonas sp. GV071]|uniref:pilus assembly PilX family protein n=1 Tax=Pseudomonas sp. GV071 TaxID=2135754 RepID=UPI000D362257|nr:PilX N-terminal domain-containing pilus assembly protein [Pseudomonas sp. GV071]PTQ67681.1 type IV pilus assembly protein PilX [Pseudomonas sp. GV071]
MKTFTPHHIKLPAGQKGASLFIALIVLLVITLLALSSTREVTLESRITGNYTEQQKLFNSAETGLRDGETSIIAGTLPLDPTTDCEAAASGDRPAPCLLALTDGEYTYELMFGTEGKSRPYHPANDTTTNPNTSINWYAKPAPSGGQDGEAENPEYGSMLGGTATFRYEVNSQAVNDNSNNATYLRSTTAKLFDNGN